LNSLIGSVPTKNVYFLLHGLYSSHWHWKKLVKSDELKRAGFTYGGNFDIDEDFIKENTFIITPNLKNSLPKQLNAHSDLVYTLNFASGFRNSFEQQAEQIASVLELFPDDSNYNYYLVGHSMGGLAARCYVVNHSNRPIKGIITIGTPNLGSYLGKANPGLTSFIGRVMESLKRPDNLLTYISHIWKDDKKNVVPALAPHSPELNSLNQLTFPDSVRIFNIFSVCNTPEELDNLSDDKQIVHQILQVQKIKNFDTLQPKDSDITTLYNDLFYNDAVVSIQSQNMTNAIPNKYDVQAYHMPTRGYHDDEPADIEHLVPAMRLIKKEYIKEQYSLFLYSTTIDIIDEDYFEPISKMLFTSSDFRTSFVVDDNNFLYPFHFRPDIIRYDYGIFLINDSDALKRMQSKIDTINTYPIVIDFSLNNNYSMFADKRGIYVKVISVDEAQKFVKFVSDCLSGKIYVKKGELHKIEEQLIRYYFSNSNMTERLKIPQDWWESNLNFFQ